MSLHASPPSSVTRPRQRQNLRLRPIDDGALLYDPVRDSVHYLNATALYVWNRCDGAHSIRSIAQQLHCEFETVAIATIEADVAATCHQLFDDALLTNEIAA